MASVHPSAGEDLFLLFLTLQAFICQELTESLWLAGHSDSVGGLAGLGLGSGLALGEGPVLLEGSLGWEKPRAWSPILRGEWAVGHEIQSQPGARRRRSLPGLLLAREFCAACSAASEDLAGWSLLCPEIDVSMGPEPRISAANEGTEGVRGGLARLQT